MTSQSNPDHCNWPLVGHPPNGEREWRVVRVDHEERVVSIFGSGLHEEFARRLFQRLNDDSLRLQFRDPPPPPPPWETVSVVLDEQQRSVCPVCDGRRWIYFNGGRTTCDGCGGDGRNHYPDDDAASRDSRVDRGGGHDG